MHFEERPVISEVDSALYEYSTELARLGKYEELARQRQAQGERYPDLYPGEPEAVRGVVAAIRELARSGKEKAEYGFQTINERKNYLALLLNVAKAYWNGKETGVMNFIYEKLAGFISDITEGKIEDFDSYTPATHGDRGIALLSEKGGSMALVEASNPELRRTVFYQGTEISDEDAQKVAGDGMMVFICGYGASRKPYEGIFEQFRLPIVVYELPHGVVNDDPSVVAEAFQGVREELVRDPFYDKITHVVGNSIGTMFASRLAADICRSDSERNVQLALIQTGATWQSAVEHTHAKFADELRAKIHDRGLTFDDFVESTKGFNPVDLVDEFAEYADKGKLDMTLCIGLGDAMITPALPQVQPLLDKLAANSKISSRYDYYASEVAGHNQAMLFFLWLCTQKATEWWRVFKDADPDESLHTFERAPAAVVKHHRRRAHREMPTLAHV